MITQAQLLVGNFAVVGLFITAWMQVEFALSKYSRFWQAVTFGGAMGAAAIASMLLAVQNGTGGLFDLRFTVVAIASFFGGPLAGLIAAGLAAAYRLSLGGGPAIAGSITIGIAAATGWGVSLLTRNRMPALISVGILSLAVGILGPAISFAMTTSFAKFTALSGTIAFLNVASTALASVLIVRHRSVLGQRNLFYAALLQSPDYQYVKLPSGRFAAVNENVARHHGFTEPKAMLGKTDFDLTTPERAQTLFEKEQRILVSGLGFSNDEECLLDSSGARTWYSSSKVALHDPHGRIIGLAGVTHNITARKRMEAELADSRDQLSAVLGGIADGIAMFDKDGVLVYCNDRYRQFFPLTAALRRPGISFRELLEAAASKHEQKDIPVGQEALWIDRIVGSLKISGERQVTLNDDRCAHIKTSALPDGSALIVVSDITLLKQTEKNLLSMTEKLELLAATDGLTGIPNRRAFDITLEKELARNRRASTPLSLLLLDVDHFKAYNDHYGHQAGDEVLKSLARCLKDALKRPADFAARYGGEEFVVILPDTDEDGALFIADTFRSNLADLGIAHQASEQGRVTASVGMATLPPSAIYVDAMELIGRADAALYAAKEAGRDQTAGWKPAIHISKAAN